MLCCNSCSVHSGVVLLKGVHILMLREEGNNMISHGVLLGDDNWSASHWHSFHPSIHLDKAVIVKTFSTPTINHQRIANHANTCSTLVFISMSINQDRSKIGRWAQSPAQWRQQGRVSVLIAPCQPWTVGAALAAGSIHSWIWMQTIWQCCHGVVTCRWPGHR